jgi:hypothetical protein
MNMNQKPALEMVEQPLADRFATLKRLTINATGINGETPLGAADAKTLPVE